MWFSRPSCAALICVSFKEVCSCFSRAHPSWQHVLLRMLCRLPYGVLQRRFFTSAAGGNTVTMATGLGGLIYVYTQWVSQPCSSLQDLASAGRCARSCTCVCAGPVSKEASN